MPLEKSEGGWCLGTKLMIGTYFKRRQASWPIRESIGQYTRLKGGIREQVLVFYEGRLEVAMTGWVEGAAGSRFFSAVKKGMAYMHLEASRRK